MVATAAHLALSRAVLPADVRTSNPGPLGVPVLLLVSICMGCFIIRADGNRLLEVQKLKGI